MHETVVGPPQERNIASSLSWWARDVRRCYRRVPSKVPAIETVPPVAAASCRHADAHWPWPSVRRWSWLRGMAWGGRTIIAVEEEKKNRWYHTLDCQAAVLIREIRVTFLWTIRYAKWHGHRNYAIKSFAVGGHRKLRKVMNVRNFNG